MFRPGIPFRRGIRWTYLAQRKRSATKPELLESGKNTKSIPLIGFILNLLGLLIPPCNLVPLPSAPQSDISTDRQPRCRAMRVSIFILSQDVSPQFPVPSRLRFHVAIADLGPFWGASSCPKGEILAPVALARTRCKHEACQEVSKPPRTMPPPWPSLGRRAGAMAWGYASYDDGPAPLVV